MIVIVSKNVRNIWDVKGKRFCHPGLDTTDDWTNSFSTVNYFIIIFYFLLFFYLSYIFYKLIFGN